MSPARRPEALSYRKDCQWSSPYRGSRLGTQFGPYELRSLIGVGGMGEVYRAYDTTKGRMVAVKILRSEMAADPSFQERFRRESRMAARLQEPHVIPVHDFGDIGGVLFIGMRLMNGRCANIPATRPFGTSCSARPLVTLRSDDGSCCFAMSPPNRLLTAPCGTKSLSATI